MPFFSELFHVIDLPRGLISMCVFVYRCVCMRVCVCVCVCVSVTACDRVCEEEIGAQGGLDSSGCKSVF